MSKILANDGIDAAGKKILEAAGITVITDKVAQEKIADALKDFDGILVRSATTVRKEVIDAVPNLKLIGRAGVGMDNIDVQYAKDKGLAVLNTPAASSQSVAELVFAHLLSGARFMHDSNRNLIQSETKESFDVLKKKYSAGIELRGKTLGIIGAGQIGMSVAAMAIGLGMNVLFNRKNGEGVSVDLDFHPALKKEKVRVQFSSHTLEEVLAQSDFITLHIPFSKGATPVIGKNELARMKKGAGIVNTARGGVISEADLLEALDSGHIGFAGLDVFEGEPMIKEALRKNPKVSITPHIAGSTKEAQERIGVELAEKVVAFLKK